MELAYGWFLGANDLGRRIADPARGASSDGLTSTGVNTNEGAESTLMWLMAAEHMRLMRSRTAPAKRTVGAGQPALKKLALNGPALAGVATAAAQPSSAAPVVPLLPVAPQ